jgi:hypothetical protein
MVAETLDRPDGASTSAGSTGRVVAAWAVLICAVLLMLLPPVVAAISMLDPAAFDNASIWLQRLSPAFSVLDYIKAGLTIVSAVVIWKSRPSATGGRPVGSPELREVLSS